MFLINDFNEGDATRDESPLATIAQGTDVAEWKRAREALRKSEERYKRLLESVTDYIYTVEVKAGQPVATFHGPGCVAVTGYTSDDYAAEPYLWHRMVHDEDKQAVTQQAARVLAGEVVPPLEHRIIHKDGSIRWVRNTSVPRHDDWGRLVAYDGLIADITEHKLAEEARLREMQAEARAQAAEAARLELEKEVAERKQAEDAIRRRNEELTAYNAIATIVGQAHDLDRILNATLDLVLEVIGMNAGWIHQLDEGKGRDVLSLVTQRGFSPEMIEEVKTIQLGQSIAGRVAQSGSSIVVDNILDDPQLSTHTAGRAGLYALAAVPAKAKDKVLGVLSVFSRSPRHLGSHEVQLLTTIGHQIGVAIENRRLVEEAAEIKVLRELDRLRSELIANVSHELRTPLGLIKVFCTTLLREDVAFDHATQREFLNGIKQETDNLQALVDNLLGLARIQNGQLRLDKHPTDIGQLASRVMKAMEVQLTQQHRLVHDFPPEPLVASVDPKRMEEVLRNLLSNAIKYSPQGGTITVRGRRRKHRLLIQVSDQGIGIPLEDAEKIFERFYRVENEIAQSVGGVGLGLAVCRGIVESHAGRIWVESSPGAGSTFYFSLPIDPGPESHADEPQR